jgi:hypothetical protein
VSAWFDSLKQGRTFATNGPLLGFTLGGKGLGDELKFQAGDHTVRFKVWLRSIVPVDHVEIVCNGRVARELKLSGDRTAADLEGTVPIAQSGWCLLRASSDRSEHPVFDDYVYATTSPVYVSVEGSPPKSAEDAAYFIAWIDRLAQSAKASQSWNTEAEKLSVLKTLDQARQVYVSLQQ